MDEKTQERIKKLQALAERGVGGEKETAARKLQELLEKNGITVEKLGEEEYTFEVFSYKDKIKRKLLAQCIYKVMGYANNATTYKPANTRNKIGIYCTKAQKLEIELEYEFYEKTFDEQQELFISAFIQKQRIFPNDAPVDDTAPTTRDIQVALMAEGIERKTRAAMIEQHE